MFCKTTQGKKLFVNVVIAIPSQDVDNTTVQKNMTAALNREIKNFEKSNGGSYDFCRCGKNLPNR